jgi:hypothetical protein
MAEPTLKEKVEAERRQIWADTEEAFYPTVLEKVRTEVEQKWYPGCKYISVEVNKTDITDLGEIAHAIEEYRNIVDRVCPKLAQEPDLQGFVFMRVGSGMNNDGYWPQPVDIRISEPEKE